MRHCTKLHGVLHEKINETLYIVSDIKALHERTLYLNKVTFSPRDVDSVDIPIFPESRQKTRAVVQ